MNLVRQLAQSGRLRRVDVALAGWIARAFPDAAPEVALAAALAARAVADGHSALELERAQGWLAGLDGTGHALALPAPADWLAALRAAAPEVPIVCDAQGRVYLRRYFDYERRVAEALIARADAAGDAPGASDSAHTGTGAHEASDAGTDPGQQRAIDITLTHRLALVTGGPGTGKTWCVARVLAALAARARRDGGSLRIALAAPTGKAAARLGESVTAQLAALGLPADVRAQMPAAAQTVHRLLGISPGRNAPKFTRATPLPFDVVVADEVSMVDLPLMAKLLDAIAPAAHLILLGDPRQLAAVEAGNVLGALVSAADTPPLADCHVALRVNHRFGADSALGQLADAIAAGDADAAFACLQRDADGAGLAAPDPRTLVAAAAAAYVPIAQAGSPAAALAAARGYRVLTALRHGPAGCLALDRAIAAAIVRRLGLAPGARWWRGRLVLITANRPELGLYNGDTGVVFPDPDGPHHPLKVWFEGTDGAPRAFAPAALPPHEGAFALTVHKAQGSEFERVALVAGPDSAVLTRELLYTGVTRARSALTVYADPEVLRAGIARPTLRMTGLADRLREAAGRARSPEPPRPASGA